MERNHRYPASTHSERVSIDEESEEHDLLHVSTASPINKNTLDIATILSWIKRRRLRFLKLDQQNSLDISFRAEENEEDSLEIPSQLFLLDVSPQIMQIHSFIDQGTQEHWLTLADSSCAITWDLGGGKNNWV